SLWQLAVQLEAHHLRDEHGDRLTEQRGLGLNPSHAPAHYAERVDHRGVRIRADDGVGMNGSPLTEDDAGQILEVDLMADARVRRHHPEIPEGLLAPAQDAEALAGPSER